MTRTVSAALLTALGQTDVHPYYAIELDFDSGPIRLWTGYGDKTIDSNTYTGSGSLLNISGMEEVNDLSAKSITLTLSGISSSIISLALTEPYQRRECKVYFGTTDTSTPVEVFSGLINTMTIEDSGETSAIKLVVESKLVRLERASNRRYTQENHIARHAGDNFFSYVTKLQDREIVWNKEVSPAAVKAIAFGVIRF